MIIREKASKKQLDEMAIKAQILDIAMNLNRVGNWAADDYVGKRARIQTFLGNTTVYIQKLDNVDFPATFAGTFSDFTNQYTSLEKEGLIGPRDPLVWAESMMTWGNILTHRSKFLG